MAEIGNGLRGSFGGQVPGTVAIAPELGHRQKIALQGVVPLQRPIGMQVLAAFEMGLGQAVDGQLHGINRIAAAGEYCHFHQSVKGLIQGLPSRPLGAIGPGGELGYGHAVFGEGAGFIHG